MNEDQKKAERLVKRTWRELETAIELAARARLSGGDAKEAQIWAESCLEKSIEARRSFERKFGSAASEGPESMQATESCEVPFFEPDFFGGPANG
ncbi:MAG: hypothetical protein GY871_04110 [Actinomycetales bacterium]|nr:hypothetical protein [Actinomycetales bacterium]